MLAQAKTFTRLKSATVAGGLLVAFAWALSVQEAGAIDVTLKPNRALPSARELTLGPDGNMWFFAQPDKVADRVLFTGTSSGRISRFVLHGRGVESAKDGAIGIGGDGRLWISLGNVPKRGKTTIYRIDKGRNVSARTLAPGQDAYSFAAGSKGKTWFLGYSGKRVGFFDSKHRLHSVRVRGANKLESVVRGPDGNMWASSRSAVTTFDEHGRKSVINTGEQPTPGIVTSGGSAWVSGVGEVTRISRSGKVQPVKLQYPEFVTPPSTHYAYSYAPYRLSYSVFTSPGALVGFTSGTQARSSSDQLSDFTSLGEVASDGIAREFNPLSSSLPGWLDNSNGADSLNPERRKEGKLAAVDGKSNLWAATDTGIVGLPLKVIGHP